jgi:simple sugar transport system permease protein
MFKTPLGLRIRAVGQNPDAAESVGINVNRTKMYALMISGVLAALGGLYLSMGYVSWFSRDMTAGRGFIAIAAATLGGMMPVGILVSSLFFALISAISIYIASLNIPSELIQLIPYLVTVVALAVFASRAGKKKKEKEAAARDDNKN